MPATYFEANLILNPDYNEILMAELGEIGYESFVETDEGLQAYIVAEEFDENKLATIVSNYQSLTPIQYSFQELETKNWNEEWEHNYQPIEVGNQVRVRASYHEQKPEFQYDVLIDPKMSFGTGHHETTQLVMEAQLALDHQEKSVLDVGSGTGILAILAEKLGATHIVAFDIEEWAYLNALENAQLNDCQYIRVFQGTIEDCEPAQYDIVLANINRNILLQQIPQYIGFMKPNSTLIVSGFYEFDKADIVQKATEYGLIETKSKSYNQWTMVQFKVAR